MYPYQILFALFEISLYIHFCFFIFQTFPKSENVESDLQNATLEVILLREEESKLRQENLQLKVSESILYSNV